MWQPSVMALSLPVDAYAGMAEDYQITNSFKVTGAVNPDRHEELSYRTSPFQYIPLRPLK